MLEEARAKEYLGKPMEKNLFRAGMLAAIFMASCGEKKEEPTKLKNEPQPAKSEPRGRPPAPKPAPTPTPTPTPVPAPLPDPAPAPKADTAEDLSDEFGAQLDLLAQAMKAVKDTASAGQAAEVVALVSSEMKSIAGRLEKLDVPPDEVRRRIHEKMEKLQNKMVDTLGEWEEFIKSVPPEAGTIVEEALARFMVTMGEVRPITARYFEVQEAKDPPIPPPVPLDSATELPGASPEAPGEPPPAAPPPPGDPE